MSPASEQTWEREYQSFQQIEVQMGWKSGLGCKYTMGKKKSTPIIKTNVVQIVRPNIIRIAISSTYKDQGS